MTTRKKRKGADGLTGSLLAMMLFLSPPAFAAEDVADACDYEPISGENPHYQVTNCLLTETALAYDIPPEIVKAVAHKENGDWAHFQANGEAIETADGGIGLMQITNYQQYDVERLKSDLIYNIQAGAEILDQMFARGDLPTINDGDRDVIEHWYFAVLAYNGTMPVNSPVVQATGERNDDAYQEKVWDIIEEYHLLPLARIPFEPGDFRYDPEVRAPIEFVTTHYETELPLTETTYHFLNGDTVYSTTGGLQFRERPTRESSSLGTIAEGEALTITGSFVYDESNPVRTNHFVWYPVQRSDGTKGFVASSYLTAQGSERPDPAEPPPALPEPPAAPSEFSDVPAGHWAATAIYQLSERGVIQGYPNGAFGLNDSITRAQAATLLARAEGISFDNRPNPNFRDVPRDHPYYAAIAAAVDEGIFSGITATSFQPSAPLTRAQMAVLLTRLYSFESGGTSHPFTDVPAGIWYEQAVQTLYANEIVAGITATAYRPTMEVTRGQFAVFMQRVID
ncbi:S-layer homology domain-containing protein [Alkalihalobacillus oceani]|uniref:S-layer homology domain-containing protein n=1 Tax=Halalkalibacter oceani TaxID=1653776 RepID=A0A9X2IM01_9BACI|nr:S-layer homology domain-containing protein [Halalkalibacter oceani]MCM3713389.1 S-layer homology domain-containing protein [Halalkalibacter oceani]